MNILIEINDGTVLVGTQFLKKGTLLELNVDGNHTVLTDATKADAILLKDTTPTAEGVHAPVVIGGVVESPEMLVLPEGVTLKDVKPVLRTKGIFLRGVK